MAAVTSISLTNPSPKGCTITFTGGNDFNAAQVTQLYRLLDRVLVEMVVDSTMVGVPVALPPKGQGHGQDDNTGHM